MTVIEDAHADHGATVVERGGRRAVADYGRPARSHTAVRKVVGVIEHTDEVLTVEGEDRVEVVADAVSNRVPDEDGEGCYAFVLDSGGRVEADAYVYNAAAGDRLLVFLPPGESERVAAAWRGRASGRDVGIRIATDEFGLFGVYGPRATEKVASVLNGAASPDAPLSFVRGTMVDAGVTVIRDDGLTGEEGYIVVCAAGEAADVFDTLVNRGLNAAPFGYTTWNTLTVEAGTPLFETELRGRLPADLGIGGGPDVGSDSREVGSHTGGRGEQDGGGDRRLVGLLTGVVPDAGAAVVEGGRPVGTVTRGIESPTREIPLALALVDADPGTDALAVRVDSTDHEAVHDPLPFVDGSDTSARLPRYPDDG